MQTIGITASVKIFVMMTNGVKNVARDSALANQIIVSNDWMALYHREFVVAQSAGFVENFERDMRLADVVQETSEREDQYIGSTHPVVLSESGRYSCHQQAMLECAFMIVTDRIQPLGQPDLLDRIHDLIPRFGNLIQLQGATSAQRRKQPLQSGRPRNDGGSSRLVFFSLAPLAWPLVVGPPNDSQEWQAIFFCSLEKTAAARLLKIPQWCST